MTKKASRMVAVPFKLCKRDYRNVVAFRVRYITERRLKLSKMLLSIAILVIGCTEVPQELTPISIYDEDNLLKISIEDVGKYHGEICPCVVVAFKATQLAIQELWGDEIPKREDFKIISAHPSKGHEDTFEFITRAKTRGYFATRLLEGTSVEDLSKNNYVYIFNRKSTNAQIEIRLKEDIFPATFFGLYKKVKTEIATMEEKESFELVKQQLKNAVLSLSLDKIFEVERR